MTAIKIALKKIKKEKIKYELYIHIYRFPELYAADKAAIQVKILTIIMTKIF